MMTPTTTFRSRHTDFKNTLSSGYWTWLDATRAGWERILDGGGRANGRPPVFADSAHGPLDARDHNVIVQVSGSALARAVLAEVPPASRHVHFGSMHSSQALAQSVFANLKHHGGLHLLANLIGEDDLPVFFSGAQVPSAATSVTMEAEPLKDAMNERRPTSVDVLIDGPRRIAIECKFTESDIGTCSRPREPASSPNHCDGSYAVQRDHAARAVRSERCALTQAGIRYWEHLPALFGWDAQRDREVCPMKDTYQLARNVLAATLRNGRVDLDAGHAVLVYDERNPAFQADGPGYGAWRDTRAQLLRPSALRRASWQQIVGALRKERAFDWLTCELVDRYGLGH